ncbi:DUF805 domain-containing protein [Bifidobacterium biavatii]|uniref:DUF805 domain-containing protein n=1 Tax=Bifidobacterium biavatii TaxID=762212 RepID=UPI000553D98D|nr:DUF805 domain-containing protein [Bifidobacterium biavatii]
MTESNMFPPGQRPPATPSESSAASEPSSAPFDNPASGNPYAANPYVTYAQYAQSQRVGASASDARRPALWEPWYGIGFRAATVRMFRKTFVFHGCASRGEYWWAWLFGMLVQAVCIAIASVAMLWAGVGTAVWDDAGTVAQLVCWLLLFLPDLSLSVRRLHDENLRGWWVILPTALQLGAFTSFFAVLFVGGMIDGYAGGDDGSLQVTVVATLTMLGMLLLALLASVLLMILPSDPRGARFDRPPAVSDTARGEA